MCHRFFLPFKNWKYWCSTAAGSYDMSNFWCCTAVIAAPITTGQHKIHRSFILQLDFVLHLRNLPYLSTQNAWNHPLPTENMGPVLSLFCFYSKMYIFQPNLSLIFKLLRTKNFIKSRVPV